MELREPDASDGEAIHEVARSAMTTSYALSPDQIEAIAADRFDPERLGRVAEDDDHVAVVAEEATAEGAGEEATAEGAGGDEGGIGGEPVVAGYAEAELDGGSGEIRWLFVDPEHRGRGIGTRLFEALREALGDRGVDDPRAATLQANQEGHGFFEQFGYEEVDEQQVEIADQSLVEYVFEESATESEKSDRASSAEETETEIGGGSASDEAVRPGEDETWAETDFPDTEERDGQLVATIDGGEEVYVDREEPETGREAPFFPAYSDNEFEDRYGYYCGNCGSLDVLVDEMDRTECNNCGNAHASKEEYDSGYL
jgi:GNAT superfamily N-acetyltransferase/ribosomal protein S27AE